MRTIKIAISIGVMIVSLNLQAQSYDTDAQTFITATGITDTVQKNSINHLVLDLKAASIWTKFVAIYPFVGGTDFTHKWNLKDPRDLDAAFRLTYSGTIMHSATGIKSDAATGVIDTHCPSNTTPQNSTALSFYSNNDIQYGTADMYSIYNAYNWLYIRNMGDNALIGTNSGDFTALYNPSSAGLFTSSRTASNLTTLYRNGVAIGTSSQASVTPDVTDIELFRYDGSSTVTRECAFASISQGLSDNEALALSNVVDSFLYHLQHGGGGSTGGGGGSGGSGTSDSSSVWTKSGTNIYYNSGNVGIGTTTPQSELAVKGTITAKKLVITQTNWADYVFDKNYKLPKLESLEKFIKSNKHLPEIPSSIEVGKNGVDVGINQALLLKKIEELTLIIIQQNKTEKHLKDLIIQQNNRIKNLEKAVNR